MWLLSGYNTAGTPFLTLMYANALFLLPNLKHGVYSLFQSCHCYVWSDESVNYCPNLISKSTIQTSHLTYKKISTVSEGGFYSY